jgi:hypothetical protein
MALSHEYESPTETFTFRGATYDVGLLAETSML